MFDKFRKKPRQSKSRSPQSIVLKPFRQSHPSRKSVWSWDGLEVTKNKTVGKQCHAKRQDVADFAKTEGLVAKRFYPTDQETGKPYSFLRLTSFPLFMSPMLSPFKILGLNPRQPCTPKKNNVKMPYPSKENTEENLHDAKKKNAMFQMPDAIWKRKRQLLIRAQAYLVESLLD